MCNRLVALSDLIRNFNLNSVKEIRAYLYELLVHSTDPREIMKNLALVCFKAEGNPLIFEAAAKYDARIAADFKAIYHIEAFAIQVACMK